MDFSKYGPERFLKKESSRHHYIPRFLIDGFVNESGLLYVYDKHKDRILKNLQSSKSIFFETDRNTVETAIGIQSSVIEDLIYAAIDNETSPVIKYFQNEEISKVDFTDERIAKLLFFLVTLFWRIPYTDFAAKDLMERSAISAIGVDPEILRKDTTFQKMQRAGLFKHAIDEMVKTKTGRKTFVNVHQFSADLFVIGDNPMLFEKTPTLFSEFGELDYVFAVSSRRIFSSTTASIGKFDHKRVFEYNAAVVSQSTQYVCSGNLEVLQQSVKFHKELKRHGITSVAIAKVFERALTPPDES